MATNNPDDLPPDVPPVTTPDVSERAKLAAIGTRQSGIVEHSLAVFWATLFDGIKAFISVVAGAVNELLSLLVPILTASQANDQTGFYDFVAANLNDLLGVEVSGSDIAQAGRERGRIAAMQQVGTDLFSTLAGEFVGVEGQEGAAAGEAGLPGPAGVPLTPDQGVKGAQAFMGFLLSFAVRQGNVALFTDAMSFHVLKEVREYGEMMAKNLGLSRLARRAFQPLIQTLISTPLQQALNRHYRPHVLDEKQIASTFIRGGLDRSDFVNRLQLQGFTDGDIDLLIQDSYTRMRLEDIFLLHETGAISDPDFTQRVQQLGFNTADVTLLIQARQLAAVQNADRQYAALIAHDLTVGQMTQADYDAAIGDLRIPKLEADAITRNAARKAQSHRKHLALGFVKKAYLNGELTIDELLQHAKDLGYSQDDVDLIEVEVLFEQKENAAKAAVKAAKAASKAAGKTTPTPPSTPPAVG